MDARLTPLVAGTLAPDFTLPQSSRASLALHSLHGRPLVLVFYPLDWEPVSREQLILYQGYAHEFERLGASVLGISVDHALCHAAFARDAQLHFPLLADFLPRGAVASRYGVFHEARGVSARALFVVDQWSIIRFGRAYPDLLNPGVDDVLTTLEALAAAKDMRTRGADSLRPPTRRPVEAGQTHAANERRHVGQSKRDQGSSAGIHAACSPKPVRIFAFSSRLLIACRAGVVGMLFPSVRRRCFGWQKGSTDARTCQR